MTTKNLALPKAVKDSLAEYNSVNGLTHMTAWILGSNWTNVGTEFETYVNKYLFPKMNESNLVEKNLGNRFDHLAKEKEFIGQLSEEYVFKDSVPVAMNLSKSAELVLKRNYPQMATKLYNGMTVKKLKFTLNDNDIRQNFLTLADGIKYALGVYRKKINDFNYTEELEVKATLVNYAINECSTTHTVNSLEELASKIVNTILDLQDSSSTHTEFSKASNGALGRYTTKTDLEDISILTSNAVKTYILTEYNANKFQIDGIDFTKKITSFADLGGSFVVTEDLQIDSPETLALMKGFGDYQVEKGDMVLKGTYFAYDVSETPDFKGKVVEIKPDNNGMFAYLFDINKVRYLRNTKNMLKKPFNNGEFDETTHWLHMPTAKHMSPFFNNALIKGA